MRDLSGKFSWDVSMLCGPPEDDLQSDSALGLYPECGGKEQDYPESFQSIEDVSSGILQKDLPNTGMEMHHFLLA